MKNEDQKAAEQAEAGEAVKTIPLRENQEAEQEAAGTIAPLQCIWQ